MGGWTSGWADRQEGRGTDGCIGEWVDERINGWMMGGLVVEWVD